MIKNAILSAKISGLDKLENFLRDFPAQARRAGAKALTYTANGVRFDIQRDMDRQIKGGPTAYTRRAFKTIDASEARLVATVALREDSPAKGTPWDKALAHLFTGGTRTWKRMEGAFRAIRALPPGYMMVPGAGCPLDAYGNPPRALVVRLISYFKAFGEQGYRANMTDKRKARLAAWSTTASGYKTIGGVEYFISYGRAGRPGGDRFVHGHFDQHLPMGIWSRTGLHGRDIKPVFLFVRKGVWSRKFDVSAIAVRTVSRVGAANLRKFLASEMRGAR